MESNMGSNVVAVIGSGGREHALVWKLSQSSLVSKILVAPGNAGCSEVNKVVVNPLLNIRDVKAVVSWCQREKVNFVVVGPEDPLADGLADELINAGIACFGPTKSAARIESSKHYAKQFMERHGIPTARWFSFTDASLAKEHIKDATYRALVVKASGLAAGKGVVVAASRDEACEAVDKIMKDFGSAGETIIVEELLEGEEVSILAFCDGSTVSLMPPSQDHKRLLNNDQGPNTGGMGAYCPCPQVDDETLHYISTQIVKKTIAGLKQDGCPFVGVLYAGLILTNDKAKVLEYNCRFGDPETEAILPLLKSDLYEIMNACVTGVLEPSLIMWEENQYSVGVVMATEGYPKSSTKGIPISIPTIASEDTCNQLVFHCGTGEKNGSLVTSGGRVLVAVGLHTRLDVAAAVALQLVKTISFPKAQYRTDIALRGIEQLASTRNFSMAYTDAGVDIAEANKLVKMITPLAANTQGLGVMSSLGSFGGLFDLKPWNFSDPVLVSGTDGIGTKLQIADAMNCYETVGIDLVAMCVNDILVHGAMPLFFLDYFGCNRLDVKVAQEVIKSICIGCKEAGCALLGGETAEMPAIHGFNTHELAGFVVGAMERSQLLPHEDQMRVGDVILGIASSGLHSNGFSLVRKIVERSGLHYNSPAPFNRQATLGQELLKPTTIYVRLLLPLTKRKRVKGLAHITGGGLLDNLPRILPSSLRAVVDASRWPIPPVFSWLQMQGNISEEDMLKTFNCGIGMVVVVAKEKADEVLTYLNVTYDNAATEKAWKIGTLVQLNEGEKKVTVENWTRSLWQSLPTTAITLMDLPKSPKKVAVLISGTGTNLQALIDYSHAAGYSNNFRISLVMSNVHNALGLKRAELFNIPTAVISHKDFQSRLQFDTAVNKRLQQENIDIVCLAGFMRILTGEFVRQWHGRMINIHPSLLPSFKGANAHKQVLDARVRITGCTAHYVVEEVDAGGIILQESVPVDPDDTEESLQDRVKNVEHKIFPRALELVASGEVTLTADNKVQWKPRVAKN